MTDPNRPDAVPGEPTTEQDPAAPAEPAQVDSFAAEPSADAPAEPDLEPPIEQLPAADDPAAAPGEVPATLADEEPVPPDPASEPAAAPLPAPVEQPEPEPEPLPEAAASPAGDVDPVPADDPEAAPAALAAAAPVLADPVPEDTDPGPPPAAQDAPAATPVRRRPAWLPVAAVGATVALLTAGTAFLAWQVWQEAQAEAARGAAVAAARDAARVLFSYDHTSLEQDFSEGLAFTTGRFRDEYSRTTKEVVTPVAERYDAVVEAEVIEAAVIDAQPSSASVLVFLNQATTSTRVQGQQVDQSRVRMRLVERDGRWLVEAVDAL